MAKKHGSARRTPAAKAARTGAESAELSPWNDRPDEIPGSTRSRILRAAERLFAERGFVSVSMPMIAAASGITAGAIYKHFTSKEDLFFQVVQHAVHAVPVPVEEGGEADVTSDLPRVVASYTSRGLKVLRQLAVEVHSASARHPKVRRLLRRTLDLRIRQIRDSIEAAQRAGKLDRAVDAELLASAIITFVLGLMHMETVAPQLVGDAEWQAFVEERVAALMGAGRTG